MRDITSHNFGLLIAFVLPGFLSLWGAAYLSPLLRSWLTGAGTVGPTVGGFLYVTLASVGAGMAISTVRWALLDRLHHATGLPQPTWDFSRLQEHVSAYQLLHDIHYKFYQFNGNGLMALLFVWIARRISLGLFTARFGWFDVGMFVLALILFVGSRDTLTNYYQRVDDLLGVVDPSKSDKDDSRGPVESSCGRLKRHLERQSAEQAADPDGHAAVATRGE